MLKDLIKKISDYELSHKEKIAEEIRGLRTQNPDIQSVSNNAYILKGGLSSLSFDPLYYNFEWQWQFLLKKLEQQSITQFANSIEELVQTGKIDGRRFHPEVIDKIKSII